MAKEKHIPSEELQKGLKDLIASFELTDRPVREWQLRKWKRLKYLWEGFANIWWDSVAHDWRVWDLQNDDGEGAGEDYGSYYDKPANIFRALLESIIAALSVQVPGVQGVPDDADNVLDILTAKAASKINALIDKHNNYKLLWLHALYIYMTEGLTFIYNYKDEDNKYGSYQEPKYEDMEIQQQTAMCPICGTPMQSNSLDDAEKDEFQPDDDDAPLHDILFNKDENICPQCMVQVDPELQESTLIVPRIVGYTKNPKSRQCIEAYGGLNVKVPNYCTKQENVPILRLSCELDKSYVIEKFCSENEELADKLRSYKSGSASSVDSYEKWARLSPQYVGEFPLNTPTVNQYWIRPWAFNELDTEVRNALRNKYPDGCKVVVIENEIAYCCNEALDDHWTLTRNPLSMHVHFEPAGEALVPMQEVVNEVISLELQTIEHGIEQTFFDPSVLDSDAYRQQQATPGQLFPATPKAGKSLSDAFFSTKTASLSPEVMPFMEFIQQMAQMVSGALPSLWGGAAPNSSKTASQYSMARAQALQRLQNQWEVFKELWRGMAGKVIPQYMKCIKEDEHYVDQDDRGNFFNVFIRVAELQGKIGSIELEASEQLPLSFAQKKDGIMQLLASANPIIQQMLSNPANFELIKSVVGVPELELPGGDQREYQLAENDAIINTAPQMVPVPNPMTGQVMPQPKCSVPTNPFDNDQLHAEICVEILTSERGRLLKQENQQGYANLVLHWQEHNQKIQQQQMQQMQLQEAMNQSKVSQDKPNTSSSSGNPQSAANNGDIRQPFIAPVRKNVITQ